MWVMAMGLETRDCRQGKQHVQRLRGHMEPHGFRAVGRVGCGCVGGEMEVGGGIGRRGTSHLTWYQPIYLATLPSCLASLALGLDDFPKLPHAQQRPMLIMASVPIKLGAEQAYGVSPTLAGR